MITNLRLPSTHVEPRRPLGQVKDTEKREGLHQYSELIPSISYATLSYNQVVESAKSILSTPTDLESQSLVLAFGGPDIFFARTSPSKGFDLLPESFNRALLSIVVAGLMVVLVVVQVSLHGFVFDCIVGAKPLTLLLLCLVANGSQKDAETRMGLKPLHRQLV